MVGQMPNLVNYGRRVQKRLARNAADVETDAAERLIALDQNRLHFKVCCSEGGRVDAWTGTEYKDFAFDVCLARIRGRDWRRCWRCYGGSRRFLCCSLAGRIDDQDYRTFADLVVGLDL